MSHFTVLVIGDEVEKQLAPFEEFECSGTESEFVESLDQTEEFKKDFKEKTKRVIIDLEGKEHSPYGDEFYRDPTPEEQVKLKIAGGFGHVDGISYSSKDWNDGKGYRAKVKFVPEGWVEKDIPYGSEVEFYESYYGDEGKVVPHDGTVDITGVHKFGHVQLDKDGNVAKVIRRTNPKRHWDWYQIGGRWAGFFPLKEGVNRSDFPASPNFSWGWDAKSKETVLANVDSAPKKLIDLAKKMDLAEVEASKTYDFVHSMVDFTLPYKSWDAFRADAEAEKITYNEARELYHDQESVKAFKKAGDSLDKDAEHRNIFIWQEFGEFNMSKEDFILNARAQSIRTFAVLKDGVWYERGNMGWWGIVCNETDESEWNRQYLKLIEDLSDDTILTVVDCHI
jgi:hypothetical protein